MDSSMLANQQRKICVQNQVLRRRLEIEEPIIKKANTTKSISCCLFGIPDPVENENKINNANEMSMLEFKTRWNLDPKSGEPIYSTSRAHNSSSVIGINNGLTIYDWEKLIEEDVITVANELQFNLTPSANVNSFKLLFAPPSASILPEVRQVDNNVVDTPDVTETTERSDITEATETSQQPSEFEFIPIDEDMHQNNNSEHNSSMETTSPIECKLKIGKTLRQCRITEYMKVTKRTGRGKKLR